MFWLTALVGCSAPTSISALSPSAAAPSASGPETLSEQIRRSQDTSISKRRASEPTHVAPAIPDENWEQAEPPNPEVQIIGHRHGKALHVRVIARITDQRKNSQFEEIDDWRLQVMSRGAYLKRLVNGSSRVIRDETSDGLWDVTIMFDAAFGLRSDATITEISVAPPGDNFQHHLMLQ